MFQRSILKFLRNWRNKPGRKPLIVRGARQVGKTTAVEMFGGEFTQFVSLNLEKEQDRQLFGRKLPVKELWQGLLLLKEKESIPGETLLFLDEIQNSTEAIGYLRYFYEEIPDLHIIAAGSLFGVLVEPSKRGFPVGRVEYTDVMPMSFQEFLEAMDYSNALELIRNEPIPDYAHDRLIKLFGEYTLAGGMPEVLKTYRDERSIVALKPYYESLIQSYKDDVVKYAGSKTVEQVLRHCIESAPYEAGKRIKYEGFGQSSYSSRLVSQSLKLLQRAMLLTIVHPTTDIQIPLRPDYRKSPKLFYLDTGLLNYCLGIQGEFFISDDLHDVYRGSVIEHIVFQEFQSIQAANKPVFWVRQKRQSSAELDALLVIDGTVTPVEIKSGKSGTLRSLHQFVERSECHFAVRLYTGQLKLETARTPSGKSFRLLNLPVYLASMIQEYVRHYRDSDASV